jgi:hypothetical protein
MYVIQSASSSSALCYNPFKFKCSKGDLGGMRLVFMMEIFYLVGRNEEI